ncbi:MAG: formylmethanofuran dehydrogenase subunit B [Candidatus Bathyarchaeota archaeon]|nr:formylmethanofuran dehydrogenase subunit B [Candidatus Bathyarchaeota archaeon]
MSIVKAVTCPVCGSLCDDIELTVENNEVVKVKNGCAMCESKYLGYKSEHRIRTPLVRKDGKFVPVSMDEAVHKAAEILANANYPILYGWSSTNCEAQRVGVELAEEVGGVLDNTAVVCHGPSILSVQEVGIPTCTLGQIRHRADLMLYWGCDPWSAHPRHLERYTSFTEGRFEDSAWKAYLQKVKAAAGKKKLVSAERLEFVKSRPRPQTQACTISGPPQTLKKDGRKLIVIDVRKSMTAEMADYFIQVEPNKDYEVMQAIRALVRDHELDVDKVGGIPVEYLEEVADALVNCNFGVIFFGMGLTQSAGKFRNIDVAISLIRDLNRRTKFAIMPMRGHFNVAGANIVSTWQSGYPYGVDFSLGYPRYNPGETTCMDVLLRGESDASLVIAADPGATFPKRAVEHMVKTPLIVIDPHMNATAMLADIVFPSAFVGIEVGGTAYRMDNVPLPLKKVVEPPAGILPDEEILKRILEEVRIIKAQKMAKQAEAA